jgi:hypothetical protein
MLLFAIGVVATVAAVGLVAPFGRFWAWTFSENDSYLLADVGVAVTVGRIAATTGVFAAFHITLVVAGFAAGRDRVRNWSQWRTDIDLWLWVAAGFVAVLAGFRFFGHQWLQVIPPVVVLAAPRLAALRGAPARWAAAGIVVPTALTVAFALTPSTFRTDPDSRALVAYVTAHTEPGETVFVWGNFPEIHWRSGRPPGGGLVHSDFISGWSTGRDPGSATLDDATDGALDALFRSFERNPPRLVLDTSPAGVRYYDAYPLADFPAIHDWVVANYEFTTTMDGVDVWTRRPAADP